jgi:hypothetical protein
MQQYFQQLRTLDELDASDGVAMGEALMLKMKNEKKIAKAQKVNIAKARVDAVFANHAALSELERLHPSIKLLIAAAIKNRFLKGRDVRIKLDNLSAKEGKMIGEGLALALVTNTAPESAIDEWVHRYAALQEIERRFVWFRPMMNTLGKRILASSRKGAQWRVCSGATLSTLDSFSDTYMIFQFFRDENFVMAWGVSITIIANLALQAFIGFGQNRKMSVKYVVRELFMTALMLQPVVLAWRVATGEEKGKDLLFRPELELSLSRITELIAESLPSIILQSYAFIKAKKKSKLALTSIIISAMTISFIGTIISWDFDTLPHNRHKLPTYFGYIKNDPSSRLLTFIAMFLVTVSHILMKTLSTSLLMLVNSTWLLIVMVGEMSAYLLMKLARGDMRYWFNIPGSLGMVVSVVVRIASKLLADHTACLHMRHS